MTGVCGTDGHIHEGEFITKFPVRNDFSKMKDFYDTVLLQLIPGHEVVGTIAGLGKDVKDFAVGDRCVADPGVTVSDSLNYVIDRQKYKKSL